MEQIISLLQNINGCITVITICAIFMVIGIAIIALNSFFQ